MNVELSARHDELIDELYELRSRMSGISRDERLILEAAIMMTEFLDRYAAETPEMDLHESTPGELEEATSGDT